MKSHNASLERKDVIRVKLRLELQGLIFGQGEVVDRYLAKMEEKVDKEGGNEFLSELNGLTNQTEHST